MSITGVVIATGAGLGEEISGSIELSTLPITMQIIGSLVFLFPASYFAKLFSRKVSFVIGASIGLISSLIVFYAIIDRHFWLLCIGTLLIGFQNAFAQYYRYASTEVTEHHDHAMAISVVLSGGVLAALIAPEVAKIGELLLPTRFLGVSLGLALLSVLQMLVMITFYRDGKKREAVEEDHVVTKQIRSSALVSGIVIGALCYGVMTVLMNAAPVSMQFINGMSFHHSTEVIRWHIFAMYAPSFVTGFLTRKLGEIKMIWIGAGCLVLCVSVAVSGSQFTHYLVALVLLGVGWNFLYSISTLAVAKNVSDHKKARMQAVNDTLIFSTSAACSFIAGPLIVLIGWNTLNVMMLPLILVILVVSLFLRDSDKNNR